MTLEVVLTFWREKDREKVQVLLQCEGGRNPRGRIGKTLDGEASDLSPQGIKYQRSVKNCSVHSQANVLFFQKVRSFLKLSL